MSLVSLLKRNGPSGFGYGSTAEQVTEGLDLSRVTALVTGSTSGLGHETVRVLLARGAKVLAVGRSEEKVVAAGAGSWPSGWVPLACDLTDLGSVRNCVQQVSREHGQLNLLIANAGIMALPELQLVDGYEKQFFVNHLAHFALITGLLDRLSERARVVMLSSSAHHGAPREGVDFDNLKGERGYSAIKAYGRSKLSNLLFARRLARELTGLRTANAVHPGVIATNLGRHLPKAAALAFEPMTRVFGKSIPEGAATQCYVGTHPAVAGVSGQYFADCNLASSSKLSHDVGLQDELWDRSWKIVEELAPR